MKKISIVLTLFALFLAGCQTGPTKIYQTRDLNVELLQLGAKSSLVIDEETVVVDARKPFDYHLTHIPGSVNVQWQEFSEHRSATPGLLKKDSFSAARRLARLGIDLDSKVIVVGYGKSGDGEAGRLAWTFFTLGIKNVQFVDINYFKNNLTNAQSPPHRNRPLWKPKGPGKIDADKTEFLQVVTSAKETDNGAHVIDVRSKEEYFSKKGLGDSYETPDVQAIHIDWREFLTKEGRPNLRMRKKLLEIGVKPGDRVLVISNQGIRSAAITMAMLSMGYNKASNFSGGFKAIVKRK